MGKMDLAQAVLAQALRLLQVSPCSAFSPWIVLGRLAELSMLVGWRLGVSMTAAGAHRVRTGGMGEAERRCGQGCTPF